MPTVVSVLLREQIKLLKPVIVNMSVEKMRSSHEKLGELGTRAMKNRVSFNDFEIGSVPACLVKPNTDTVGRDAVVLYLHGGAYVAGNLKYARRFSGTLADALDMDVLSIAYRLAPEHPYPAALEDALSAYNYLLSTGHAAEDITLVGESAGGGLLLALTLKLRDDGMPLPARLVPISPWTDLTLSGESYVLNEKRDPTLELEHLKLYVKMYAQGAEREPYISPLMGSLTGLPPTLIFAGGDELLLDDARSLHKKLIHSGVASRILIEEGMWHAYMLYPVPEAKRAMRTLVHFIKTGELEFKDNDE